MSTKTSQAINYLMFSALSEIQLDMYQRTRNLVQYDPALETKLKNLKANFERTSKHAHGLFTEQEQLIFFDMINVFESLIESAIKMESFTQLMDLIKAWKNKEITVINSTQELIETADKAKEKNLNSTNHECN
jgi:hypothetical protein